MIKPSLTHLPKRPPKRRAQANQQVENGTDKPIAEKCSLKRFEYLCIDTGIIQEYRKGALHRHTTD